MAGNGDAQRLEQLERAIMGVHPMQNQAARPPAGEIASPPNVPTDDVVARAEAVGALCREAGRYARDHGAYIDEISQAFADRLQTMTADYAKNLLAAEERKMAKLREIMGKLAG